MSNYTKSTNFATKDTLPTGNASKIVKGTELDTEFNAIASAISSKADTNSPALTGAPTAPTPSSGSNTTQLATTAYVKGEVDTSAALKADKTTTITGTGALTGGGDLSANRTIDIASSGVTAATYGSATKIPVIAVNAKGQITSAGEATIVPFAWNVSYVNTTINEGSSYTLPANCIQVNGYITTLFGGNTGGMAKLDVRDANNTVLGTVYDGLTSGNDGGGGAGFDIPVTIPCSSNANNILVTRSSGGNAVSFVVTSYVTKA